MCHILGLGMGMHSGIELGIGVAVMAHTGVTIPNLTLAVDAHYHHLIDDVICGPRLLPDGDGRLAPPEGAGRGVTLDDEKVGTYRELHASGKYANVYAAGTPSTDQTPCVSRDIRACGFQDLHWMVQVPSGSMTTVRVIRAPAFRVTGAPR